jgi:5-methylcytosine-specific restriction endonuclease McrA
LHRQRSQRRRRLLDRRPRAIDPLAPERYKIQLTAGRELKQKLEQCRDLMRHANPAGEFAPIIERALDLLLEKLMRERFGATERPRLPKASSSKHIDRVTRRAVASRDGLRCAWVSPDGERCSATAWLELDHQQPRAKGGTSAANNVRVLCRAHNQLAAELEFGREAISGAIGKRRQRHQREAEPEAID